MTAEQSIKLPTCFGDWRGCVMCLYPPLKNACRVRGESPRVLSMDIDQVVVESLAGDARPEIRVLVDVLDGLT